MVVLGAWMYFMPTPAQPPAPVAVPAATASSSSTTSASTSASESKTTMSVAKTASVKMTSNIAASSVTIETDDYIATFSNQGAVLTDFRLKKFENRQTHQPIELVNPDSTRSLH